EAKTITFSSRVRPSTCVPAPHSTDAKPCPLIHADRSDLPGEPRPWERGICMQKFFCGFQDRRGPKARYNGSPGRSGLKKDSVPSSGPKARHNGNPGRQAWVSNEL